MTNTCASRAANRLVSSTRDNSTIEPIYNGVGDRVGQTAGLSTTNYALDVAAGLPEVIYTTEGNAYLHLPGVIMAESAGGDARYLLSDGLSSVRQAVDDASRGALVAYHEFDPYGNPTDNGSLITDYGYTGEWWQDDLDLLFLRARWYAPGTGTFLSVDPVESEPPYQYVRGNVVNRTDSSGLSPERDEVGDRYVYSCNCGWIDWDHAQARGHDIIKAVEDVQTGNWDWASLSLVPSSEGKGLSGVSGEVYAFTNLSNSDVLRVSLGIFISKENLFEAHQGGKFFPPRGFFGWTRKFPPASWFGAPSTFAEEDLISNLIGFHRGRLTKIGVGEDATKQKFERECKVVGLSLLESGRVTEFVEKQQEIFDQYGSFQKVSTWGKPRLGAWNGSVEIDCVSEKCTSSKVPSSLLWIEPEPPFPDQSSKPTWSWISGKATFFGNTVNISSNTLNQRPLNWRN